MLTPCYMRGAPVGREVPLQRKIRRVPSASPTLASVLQEENAGLVKLVVDSQTKRNVQRLTQTYLTLSLPDIAAAVGLPSAQAAELAILRWAAPAQWHTEHLLSV